MSLSNDLKTAENALARGDYKECLEHLEKLAKRHDPSSQERARIQLLMVTACIGQGEQKKAIRLCQDLARHQDYSYRQQAKDLISILDAPILSKPKNWSVTIPLLDITPSTKKRDGHKQILIKKPQQLLPQTGPTQSLKSGFTVLFTIIFLALTILLSGCVQFTTELELTGPDRLKVAWDIQSNSNQLLPWQEQFTASLKDLKSSINVQTKNEGKQIITSPQVNAREANLLLQRVVDSATKTAGFNLTSPEIIIKEKNLLIGVEQHLSVIIDLKELPEFPGLKLLMVINPNSNKKISKGYPLPASIDDSQINWELAQGLINKLELYSWQWSRLGLGIIVVILITITSVVIQNLKIKLGFGFPELPP